MSLALLDPTDDPVTEEEVVQIAAAASTVKVKHLRVHADLTNLSPPALHRLLFGFSSIKELTLYRFNGNQIIDDHLRKCGRRQIFELDVSNETADGGPLALSDEAMLDYLYAPDNESRLLSFSLWAFNASPQFVHKLISVSTLICSTEHH